jgi:hypothetical protein
MSRPDIGSDIFLCLNLNYKLLFVLRRLAVEFSHCLLADEVINVVTMKE